MSGVCVVPVPERAVVKLGLSLEEVVWCVGSPGLVEEWRREGKLRGRRVGRAKLLFDAGEVERCWREWFDGVAKVDGGDV